MDTLGGPPFDAILIADGGDRLRSVASLLTFFDVDPADDPLPRHHALAGRSRGCWRRRRCSSGWFAASPPDDHERRSSSRFQAAFGRQPQQLAALAYDATALAVIVARDLRRSRLPEPTLTNPEGFAGATGLFRLRPDGLADHGLAILEVAGAATRMIDPAAVQLGRPAGGARGGAAR